MTLNTERSPIYRAVFIEHQRANVHAPWFWICREMYCGLRGPSGEEPFTQKMMLVKSGSDTPVKLQPLLTPFEMMYVGHSLVCSSSLCLQRGQTYRDVETLTLKATDLLRVGEVVKPRLYLCLSHPLILASFCAHLRHC